MEIKSIMTKDFEHCFVCGKQAQQWHHVLGAANRKKSEKYGLLIPVCAKCHSNIHDKSQELNNRLKKEAQADFLMEYSIDLWRKEFGKNYL